MTESEIRAIKTRQMDKLAEWREHLYREPELRELFLELTLRCNERCFHCGSRCESDAEVGMPAAKYLEVLTDVRDHFGNAKPRISITGGEPLMRRDFFEIMGAAHEMGFSWGMTSNGTLITPAVARKLRETGMRTISVSIDGLPETHDRLRGLPGGWKLAMAGVENLIAEGGFGHIQVTTVFNHGNIGELDALYEMFRDMDIDSWRVIGLEPIGRALMHPDLMLTAEDQKRLFDFIRSQRNEGMPVTYGCSHYLGLEYEREVRRWYFLCNAGRYVASVMANGDVGACLDIERRPETIQGNVYEDRFTDIWRNRFGIFRQPISRLSATCRDCEHEKYCAGGAAHSWDFDKNEQRICMKGILF